MVCELCRNWNVKARGRLASGSENSVVSRLDRLSIRRYFPTTSILSTVLFYEINWASEQVKEVLSVRKKSVTLDIFECCLHGSIRDIYSELTLFFGLEWFTLCSEN